MNTEFTVMVQTTGGVKQEGFKAAKNHVEAAEEFISNFLGMIYTSFNITRVHFKGDILKVTQGTPFTAYLQSKDDAKKEPTVTGLIFNESNGG